jgi:hypothetical protein
LPIHRTLLAAALCAAATAISAQEADRARPDRRPIDVTVVNGKAVVDEDVAVTQESEGALVWHIVQPGYQFADNGIVVDSGGRHKCGPVADGRGFRCRKLKHVSGAKAKYVVRLIDVSTQKALDPLDPWIVDN